MEQKLFKYALLSLTLLLAPTITSIAFSASHDSLKKRTADPVTNPATSEINALEAHNTILTTPFDQSVDNALAVLDKHWRVEIIPNVLETIAYTQSSSSQQKVIELLQRKTGQNFGQDMNQWYFWLWNKPEELSDGYAAFKASLYRNIDPKFETYFKNRQDSARIRLDEIR